MLKHYTEFFTDYRDFELPIITDNKKQSYINLECGFDIETNENFVIIGNGTVIYADGDYDDFESLNTNTVKGYCGYVITKAYSTFCRKFAECTSERIVWNNPEYVKWLDKQIKE